MSLISRYFSIYQKVEEIDRRIDNLIEKGETIEKEIAYQKKIMEDSFNQGWKELQEEKRTLLRFRDAAMRYASINGYIAKAEKQNYNLLLSWYTMLNTSSGAQYASELLKKCADGLLFIEEKENEIKYNISKISEELYIRNNMDSVIKDIEISREKRKNLICGDDAKELVKLIDNYSKKFSIQDNITYHVSIPDKTVDKMCFGYVHLRYYLFDSIEDKVKDVLGQYYCNGKIRVPYLVDSEQIGENGLYSAPRIRITYSDRMREASYHLIQGLIFNILRNYKPLVGRVSYIDLETFNDEYLGEMRSFVGEDNLINFSKSAEDVKSILGKLEHAVSEEPEGNRNRRYLIVRGGRTYSMAGVADEMIRRIKSNSYKNNIVVIYIDSQDEKQTIEPSNSEIYIYSKHGVFCTKKWGTECIFEWFSSPKRITPETVSSFTKYFAPKEIQNEYENFFPLNEPISYTRERRPVSLPYGVDSKGNVKYLTFEGMEFASFIMGASGSGKSTLLHALITGIIKNYHPDEVEIWLADLKLMEFSNYIYHRPPHIKYILMDSSKELVYDFIDRLHSEMERRQLILSKYGTNDCKNLPSDKYLPVLFVVIDEFSALSDIIRDDDNYKRKLEQILVRGRGPGLRLVFATQSYTDGAPALTRLAKNQIQTRIALKNTTEEIKHTLDIPSDQYTDQMRNDISTLREHYALLRVQNKDGSYRVEKVHNLYFNGRDEDGWKTRYNLIDRINNQLRSISQKEYDSNKIDQYVEKKPVVVSSKSLQVFEPKRFREEVTRYRLNVNSLVFSDDILIRFGQPRKLEEDLFALLTPELNENIFLLASNKESTCGMSVILSTIRSFLAQEGRIQVWAHSRNRIYHWYKESHLKKQQLYEGTEEVKMAIDILREKIQRKEEGNELIILLGMENIYSELSSESKSGFSCELPKDNKIDIESIVVQTSEQLLAAEACQGDEMELYELQERFFEEGEAKGKTEEQLELEFEKVLDDYYVRKYGVLSENSTEANTVEIGFKVVKEIKQIQQSKDYMKDFHELVRLGSKLGYHFMLCVNNIQALSGSGLSLKMFNHRVAFKTDSVDTSMTIFNNSSAFRLPENTCYYTAFGSSEGSYAVTPYLHKGVEWGNWTVDERGIARDLNIL